MGKFIKTTKNEVCAICQNSVNSNERRKHLCVDHDHITGKVRGLLCSNCNTALGKFKDNIELLKMAIVYLEKNKIN